jgi:cysteine desulfurase
MLSQLRAELGEEHVALNGHPNPTQRWPNNLNVSIRGIESRSLIVQLKDVAISTGSACTTANVEPSHVILALGFGEARAHSAIRIGVGRSNQAEHIPAALAKLLAGVYNVRKVVLRNSGIA